MSRLKIKAKGMSMEVFGSDELIGRERDAFLDFTRNQRSGITVNACAIPVEKMLDSIFGKTADDETEEKGQVKAENRECALTKRISKLASWQEIADKIKKNTDDFCVGDTVSCKLTDGTQTVFVVTDVTDEYVRFETKDFIGDTVSWNEDDTNEGGYPESNVKKYIDDTIWGLLPEDLRNVISETVRKWKDKGGNEDTYTAKLFLPAASEVFDEDCCYGDKGLYEQLEYYKSGRNRIRVDEDGDTRGWWLASVRSGHSTIACSVNSSGIAGNWYASGEYRVPVCFQISR